MKKKYQIKLQKFFGFLFFIPFSGSIILALKYFGRYKIQDRDLLRRQFKELMKDPRPLMICSNHLTYMDPIVIIYAMANHWWYLFHYRCVSWNLAASEYNKNLFFRLVFMLAKCISIQREGSKEHHNEVLDAARSLLEQGEVVNIFPEGRRSKIGRFDNRKLAYGIGKIISQMKECRVLCVYLKCDDPVASSFPKKNATFILKTQVLTFDQHDPSGRKSISEIVSEIASTIQGLEKPYLSQSDLPGVLPVPSGKLNEPYVQQEGRL